MASSKALSDRNIEIYLNEEIEGEDCSETEDSLEVNEHESDSEQDCDEGDEMFLFSDYNSTKCGVDIVDQMTGTYSVSRRTNRWPLCVFFGLLNIAGVNAFVIHKARSDSNDLVRKDFLKLLAVTMIQPYLHERVVIISIPQHIKNRIRAIIPQVEPPPEPSQPVSRRKVRCGLCTWKKDRKTKISCAKCNVAICGEHTKQICVNCYNNI